MIKRYNQFKTGLTLIEIMVAMLLIAVGILGAMMYRYHSALDARKADVQVGAERVAMLILQGWKGAAGLDGYDPSTDINLNSSDISISSANSGIHTVQLTGGTQTYYYARLFFSTPSTDLDGDGTADTFNIRKLEVEVTYYGSSGSQDTSLPAKTVRLSDFVRTS